MNQAEREARRDALHIDIDVRLTDVWAAAWGGPRLESVWGDDAMRSAFAAALRGAYARGYYDALYEVEEGRRDALARDNGYHDLNEARPTVL